MTECKNIAKLLLISRKNEGTESSFPVKMHSVIHHKACPSVKCHGFTDEAVKMTVSSVKWQVFTDDLNNRPSGGAKTKRKSQILENQDLRFEMYPEPGMKIEICGKCKNECVFAYFTLVIH